MVLWVNAVLATTACVVNLLFIHHGLPGVRTIRALRGFLSGVYATLYWSHIVGFLGDSWIQLDQSIRPFVWILVWIVPVYIVVDDHAGITKVIVDQVEATIDHEHLNP